MVQAKKTKKTKKPPKKKVAPKEKKAAKPKAKPLTFFEAIGRRKTSTARVRLFAGGEDYFSINKKPFEEYFKGLELQTTAKAALDRTKPEEIRGISVLVKGGGFRSQAEAVRHATARALVLVNPEFRKKLRRLGYLTRDPRMRERKKFGLKRARRAPQWQKR